MEKYLVGYDQMVADVKGFRVLKEPSLLQQAMVDLLEVVEQGSRIGLDATFYVKELVAYYKQWKYAVDNKSPTREAERSQGATGGEWDPVRKEEESPLEAVPQFVSKK